jgi:uncharacterized protein with NAD-binding domain and iron-sulfur cluster
MPSPERDGRTRVAILGGGCGAMSAAFWLTATEDLRRRYAVSVYTHGWRLGGKGASGRQHDEGDRILEHGLHMWMGFYETAFRTIRASYDEWRKPPDYPFQTWADAFTPLRQVTLEQRVPDDDTGAWQSWNFELPRLPGTPGDPDDGVLHAILERLLAWLRSHLHVGLSIPEAPDVADGRAHLDQAHRMVVSSAGAVEGIYDELVRLLEHAQGWFQRWAEPHLSSHFEICALAEIGLAVAIGYLKDVLPRGEAGFGDIDHLEFKDWLTQHGANPKYVWTAPVRCMYDLGFAYRDGDSSSSANAAAAAGVALRILLFTVAGYRDAPLWKMNAGMGDTIFTPLYEVLRARGVDFQFFHRVLDIGVSADGSRVERIELSRQVKVGDEGYDPLVTVKQLLCWPSEPKWELIDGGKPADDAAWDLESAWCLYEVDRRTLLRDADFDLVVLAIPPAALPDIGADLLAHSKPMVRMHDAMSWVATQSAQIWLAPDLAGLGWKAGPTVATSFADPFRSWGEMSHLIQRETWKTPVPGSCEYFCGTLVPPSMIPPYGGDRHFFKEEAVRIGRAFLGWADGSIGDLFPKARGAGGSGFDRAMVVSEFYRANLDPSEMYVQSFPGSIGARLDAAGSGFSNLYLAGDWTRTSLNGGCVEAAIESGKNAAEAICGHPIELPPPAGRR